MNSTTTPTRTAKATWDYKGVAITYRKKCNSHYMFFFDIDGEEHRALSLELAVDEIDAVCGR